VCKYSLKAFQLPGDPCKKINVGFELPQVQVRFVLEKIVFEAPKGNRFLTGIAHRHGITHKDKNPITM
jgi:hypothetical protein